MIAPKLPLVLAFAALGFGCGLIGKAATDSDVCKAYFAKVESCATKVGGMKADMWRKTASKTRENLEKNSNPLAVTKTCEAMLQTLEHDPDCTGADAKADGKAEPK